MGASGGPFQSSTARSNQAVDFEISLRKLLDDDPTHTEFQKQSISERMTVLRSLVVMRDKQLEKAHFVETEANRNLANATREYNKEVTKSFQRNCKNIWTGHIDKQKDPDSKWVYPGPGSYEGKHFMRDHPTFQAGKFTKTVRPLNQVNMKGQTEQIEFHAERKQKDNVQKVNDF